MSTSSLTWTEGTTQIGGAGLHIIQGGNGDPLLVLHDEMGRTAPLRYAEALAQDSTLHLPAHPGFGVTDRLDWIMSVRDLASWYLRALEELGLERVRDRREEILAGDLAAVPQLWLERCEHLGHKMGFYDDGEQLQGKFTGIDDQGHGLVQRGKRTYVVTAGDLEWPEA